MKEDYAETLCDISYLLSLKVNSNLKTIYIDWNLAVWIKTFQNLSMFQEINQKFMFICKFDAYSTYLQEAIESLPLAV